MLYVYFVYIVCHCIYCKSYCIGLGAFCSTLGFLGMNDRTTLTISKHHVQPLRASHAPTAGVADKVRSSWGHF